MLGLRIICLYNTGKNVWSNNYNQYIRLDLENTVIVDRKNKKKSYARTVLICLDSADKQVISGSLKYTWVINDVLNDGGWLQAKGNLTNLSQGRPLRYFCHHVYTKRLSERTESAITTLRGKRVCSNRVSMRLSYFS